MAMVACLENTKSDPAEWVDLHGDFLYNYAIGQLRDSSDAEDVVQETFLAALKSRERFNGEASERTWFVSILRHKICDHFRRKCLEQRMPGSFGPVDGSGVDGSMLWIHETAAECLSPLRRIDLNDFRQSLETAFHALPPRVAQAFAMYEMDECASTEVCRSRNISEANLWTMVHRARRELKKLLPRWRNEVSDSSRAC